MRLHCFLVLVGALRAVGVARRTSLPDGGPDFTEADRESLIVPRRYIIEFEPSIVAKAGGIQDATASILSHHGLSIRKIFDDPDVFYGASIEADGEGEVMSMLRNNGGVARVWPLRSIKLSKNISQRNFSDVLDAVEYNIHGPTGVEAMHKAGILGDGATVAIVDTGVDYTHPAIGGGYGPGYTVIGGADLVGDGCWPEKDCPMEPDDDPMDYQGHGTHVAGIIAGRSKWFTGVAPRAKLLAYKVFTASGWVLEDVLVEAFLEAYRDDADVITASIGAASGWQDSAWAVVADRLVENGVVVTIAAGNNGNLGPFMFSDGAAGRNVVGVAATEPDFIPQTALEVSLTANGTTDHIRMGHVPKQHIPWPSTIQGQPVVFVGSACDLPGDLNLAGKIALVERWFCSPVVKERNILAAGGRYIFIFDPVEPDRDGFYIGDWKDVEFATLVDKDGQALAAALGQGCEVNVSVPDSEVVIGMANPFAGTPSYFTSFGPTFDHAVKPDIGAPGSGILSLYLDHGFAAMDGSSMATPYVAGIAALYVGKHGGRSKHGKEFGKMVSARILASGSRVAWADHLGVPMGRNIPATVAMVGNGLVNATRVLMSETQLSFTKFALNDTHHFSRYQGLEITNNGPAPVTFTFDTEAAGGFEAYEWMGEYPVIASRKSMINNVLDIAPEIIMPTGTHKLDPGQRKRVEFIFKVPEGLNYANMPVYSGRVFVKGSNGDELSVAYLGVGGNTGKEVRNQIWFRAFGFPDIFSGYDDSIEYKHKFTFNTSLETQDFPKLVAAVNFGSPELRWDIFDEDWREHEWKYPPVPGQDGFIGSVAYWTGSTSDLGAVFDPASHNADDVLPLPRQRLTRNVLYNAWWMGRLANGSVIALGKYNMRIAVLSPFGDPRASDNWDRFPTPVIEVVAG